MDSGLTQAYYGVYCSSKEILKNNQRHLYCNMLYLLARTSKTTGISGTKIITEDYVKFWLSDILPLVFDEDKSIQQSAIAAFDIGFLALDLENIHKSPHWPAIKSEMIESYAPRIHKLREGLNSNWYKIWCTLIRILDKEILKGASTINTFLSIVELGFRSSDYNVRAEAFLCWKLLIEIFAEHNEICSPKRIKLISIPLKSSQSKTSHSAVIKLKVWWYLICKINTQIGQHFEIIVEPFLTFCFGSANKNVLNASRLYTPIKDMAILCLTAMLTERSDFIERNLNNLELELLPDAPIINEDIMQKHWQPITYSIFEAIKLFDQYTDCEHNLLQALLKTLIQFALKLDNFRIYEYIFQEMNKLPVECVKPAIITVNLLGSTKPSSCSSVNDLENYAKILNSLTKFFISHNEIIPKADMRKAINNVFSLKYLNDGPNVWSALVVSFNIIFQTEDEEDFNSFETKLLIWNTVSQSTCEYMKNYHLEYRLKEKSDNLNRWILWPLKIYGNFEGKKIANCFDDEFCLNWKNLINCGHNGHDRHIFLKDIPVMFTEIIRSNKQFSNLTSLFDVYTQALLKTEIDKGTVHQKELFTLLEVMLTKPLPLSMLEPCLNTLKNMIISLKANQLTTLFEEIKRILGLCLKALSQKYISKSFFEEFKRTVVERMKTNPNKVYFSQIKELFKSDDVFVIIPAVWSLNPDKLTERQKEKYAERADIPALYNDMSQSQDSSSLKPWTPKKIVIAKGQQEEIVIESGLKENHANKEAEAEANKDKTQTKALQQSSAEASDVPTTTTEDCHHNQEELSEKQQKQQIENKKIKRNIELSREDEELLKKWNINTDDERKKRSIVKQLKNIEIDTVDGDSYRLKKSVRAKRPLSYVDEEQDHAEKSKVDSPQKNNNKRTSETTSNEDKSTPSSSTSTQLSESVLSSKRSRKSITKLQLPSPTTENAEIPDATVNAKSASVEIEELADEKQSSTIDTTKPAAPLDNGFKNLPMSEDIFFDNTETEGFLEKNKIISEPENQNISPSVIASSSATVIASSPPTVIASSPPTVIDATPPIAIDATPPIAIDATPPIAIASSPPTVLAASPPTVIASSPPIVTASSLPTVYDFAKEVNNDAKLLVSKTKGNNKEKRQEQDIRSSTDDTNNNAENISPIPTNQQQREKEKNFDSPLEFAICASNIDNCHPKEVSPKKSTTKITPLSSPPDRKLTNNSSSPTLRHKPPSAHLTGRGAQLINMIRNKKLETSTPKSSSHESRVHLLRNDNKQPTSENMSSSDAMMVLSSSEQPSTPVQSKDLLIFSKRLPSPTASPSASILKRKLRRDSFDDINDSPAFKRKRVSFHDPPVSVTKEYVTDDDENKTKLKRCLIPDKFHVQQNSAKHILKRKSKIDSICEIEKFTNDLEAKTPAATLNTSNIGKSPATPSNDDSSSMCSLKWKSPNTTNDTISCQLDETTTLKNHPPTETNNLVFENQESALNFVTKQYPIEDILDKYVAATGDNAIGVKSTNALAKYLSTCMSGNSKIKSNVLETLSEQHSKDFLDHAVQENLSSVVCDRLNLNSVIDYVCAKSRINAGCRNNLLQQIPEIFTQNKLENERINFITEMIQSSSFSDEHILNLIEILVTKKRRRSEAEVVSESAIDSSSNL